ncbi:MAG: ATP-binding protein [candidate division WOR-3 bacterium]
MKEIIKPIIFEWQERKLPRIIPREVNLSNYLNLTVRKVIVITGFRRVGKTYLVFGLIDNLLGKTDRKDVLYINFEDERIPPRTEFLTALLPTIKETLGHLPSYLFLDEIQTIPDWSKWLRRVYDKEAINFFVTGSSSKMSSKEIPTELRGRCLEVKVYPLSFREFLKFQNIELDLKNLPYLENQKATMMRALNEYLHYGGMPEVVLAEELKKTEILQQYYATVVRRDIIERFKIKNEEGLKGLLQLLLNSTIFTTNRLYNNLKSTGFKIGKTTLCHYLAHIETAYFLKSLPIFSYKIKNQLQYPRKVYFIDNGFITTLSLKFSKNLGRLYENVVFQELQRRFKEDEIFYWRDEKQREVDFVIKKGLKPEMLLQVAYDVEDFETKRRETTALLRASNVLQCNRLIIITADYETEEKMKGKRIKFLPLWKWLLSE